MKFMYAIRPSSVFLALTLAATPLPAQNTAPSPAPTATAAPASANDTERPKPHRFFSFLFESHPSDRPAPQATHFGGQSLLAQGTAPAPAQQPAQPAPQPPGATGQSNPEQPKDYTVKVFANEVNLVFTVSDKKGKFINGLNLSSFGLLDDGRPPERVLRFAAQTNLPLRIGIMLDTSSSIRQRFKFEQDAAIDFFLQVLHQNDRAFVEGFDITTNMPQDFTNNVDLLNQGIRKLRPGGGTALYDALYNTCKNQMLTLRDSTPTRRAIIIVSDGEDNYSRAYQQEAIKMCERAETIVYAISTDTSPSRGKGGEVLKAIAQATGGQAFFPIKLEDVAIGFRNIEEELRSQYSLVYEPAEFKRDGSFRTIYLQSTDPRYHVRARSGYFSPRPDNTP